MPVDDRDVNRRSFLSAAGGLFGFGLGSFGSIDNQPFAGRTCPEATIKPSIVYFRGGGLSACADDHPATRKLQQEVKSSLESDFSTVGALIDDGYIPYFDIMTGDGDAGWSHWINPDYVGDEPIMDPARPESILVDHKWWRPMGVMFIATRDGEYIEEPPPVYGGDEGSDSDPCLPWHAHVGLPGRFAWWKYRVLHEVDRTEANVAFPCRTPWMLHVWIFPHPESVYAHEAPPPGQRGGPPAEPAGFETDAVPGEDPLDWRVLPDAVRHKFRP